MALHRTWMIRSYALTLSAVLLRLCIVVGQQYTAADPAVTFPEICTASVWVEWTVPLLVAEWSVLQPAPAARVGRRSEAPVAAA